MDKKFKKKFGNLKKKIRQELINNQIIKDKGNFIEK